MTKPKIALVAQPLNIVVPPFQTSIGLWIYEVAQCRKDTCNLVVYTRRNRLQSKTKGGGSLVYRHLPTLHFRILLEALKPFGRFVTPTRPFFAKTVYCLDYAIQLAVHLKADPCDVVHIQNFPQLDPFIRRFHPRVPIVLHMHCEWLTQLDHGWIADQLKYVDRVLGCSDFITDQIKQSFPEISPICHTIYNGVDTSTFIPSKSPRPKDAAPLKILFVGRNSPEKGLHVLLEALAQVVRRFPEANLEIIGVEAVPPLDFVVALSRDPMVRQLRAFYGGSYVAYLKALSHRLGLDEQVSFTGFLSSREALIERFRQESLVVMPSVWPETFGIPLVEAMASGVPVIASRVGGMVEVVDDEKTGLLVEPNDLAALSHAISRLLLNPSLRKVMGRVRREKVERQFTWARIGENPLKHYQGLCGRTEN